MKGICKFGCRSICGHSCPFADYDKIREQRQQEESLALQRRQTAALEKLAEQK